MSGLEERARAAARERAAQRERETREVVDRVVRVAVAEIVRRLGDRTGTDDLDVVLLGVEVEDHRPPPAGAPPRARALHRVRLEVDGLELFVDVGWSTTDGATDPQVLCVGLRGTGGDLQTVTDLGEALVLRDERGRLPDPAPTSTQR